MPCRHHPLNHRSSGRVHEDLGIFPDFAPRSEARDREPHQVRRGEAGGEAGTARSFVSRCHYGAVKVISVYYL